MRFNVDHAQGGWTYYRAAGVGQWTRSAAGPNIECQEQPLKYGVLWFRVRQAGTRLSLQFAEDVYQDGSTLRCQTPVSLTRA